MAHSIDFLRRGQFDHTLAPAKKQCPSPKHSSQFDLNDSSDEEFFARHSEKMDGLPLARRPLARKAQATITCADDDFEEDDFQTLPKSYNKKCRVEPADSDRKPISVLRIKDNDSEYAIPRTAPAAQSSPVPTASRVSPTFDEFDTLFSRSAKPRAAQTYAGRAKRSKKVPFSESPEHSPVIKDNSQEYSDYFADEDSKSSHNKVKKLFSSQGHVAGTDLKSPVLAGRTASLRPRVIAGQQQEAETSVGMDNAIAMETSGGGDADLTDELKLHISGTVIEVISYRYLLQVSFDSQTCFKNRLYQCLFYFKIGPMGGGAR